MPRPTSRLGRIADQIQRDVAELVRTEVKDPWIGFITLTGVEVTPDYRHAKVYFTVLGPADAASRAERGLQRAAGFLRSRLAQSLPIRVAPELHFVYDTSVERGARLSRLIDEAVASSAGKREPKKD
jgi:ribosome-binding factor A